MTTGQWRRMTRDDWTVGKYDRRPRNDDWTVEKDDKRRLDSGEV